MKAAGIEPNHKAYAMVAVAYNKEGNVSAIEHLLRDATLTPNEFLYRFLLTAQAKDSKSNIKKTVAEMKRRGLEVDAKFFNSLLKNFTERLKYKEADKLFVSIPERDAFSYNLMLHMYTKLGQKSKAQGLIEQLSLSGLVPDIPLYNSIIGWYMDNKKYDEAEQLLQGIKGVIEFTPALYTSMLYLYRETGNIEGIQQVLAEMKEKGQEITISCYAHVLLAHTKRGDRVAAESVMEELKSKMQPNSKCYRSMIDLYHTLGDRAAFFKALEGLKTTRRDYTFNQQTKGLLLTFLAKKDTEAVNWMFDLFLEEELELSPYLAWEVLQFFEETAQLEKIPKVVDLLKKANKSEEFLNAITGRGHLVENTLTKPTLLAKVVHLLSPSSKAKEINS